MMGYGAYGLNLDLGFNIANITAVERDWVIAMAHVRGGGEKGFDWHSEGKLEKKGNSFFDFISCAEHLIAERVTHPNLLAVRGESAGGMLVAQCLNMRPELFRAAILKVPFLDVFNTLIDETLPLSLTDHLEFGNPGTNEEYYKLINSYSPYENILN
jgi:oligopeptidase B